LPQTQFPLAQLPNDKFLAEVSRRFNGMSSAILGDAELVNLVLPPLRADITALETYVMKKRTLGLSDLRVWRKIRFDRKRKRIWKPGAYTRAAASNSKYLMETTSLFGITNNLFSVRF